MSGICPNCKSDVRVCGSVVFFDGKGEPIVTQHITAACMAIRSLREALDKSIALAEQVVQHNKDSRVLVQEAKDTCAQASAVLGEVSQDMDAKATEIQYLQGKFEEERNAAAEWARRAGVAEASLALANDTIVKKDRALIGLGIENERLRKDFTRAEGEKIAYKEAHLAASAKRDCYRTEVRNMQLVLEQRNKQIRLHEQIERNAHDLVFSSYKGLCSTEPPRSTFARDLSLLIKTIEDNRNGMVIDPLPDDEITKLWRNEQKRADGLEARLRETRSRYGHVRNALKTGLKGVMDCLPSSL